MKYIYEDGVRTFRGYFFYDRKPVNVTDRATLDAIKREKGFVEYEEVEETKAAAPVLAHAENAPAPVANACPKCGRALHAKGAHFHIRRCTG